MPYDAHRKEGEHSREYQTVTDHLTGTAATPPPKSRASRGRRVDRNVYGNRFLSLWLSSRPSRGVRVEMQNNVPFEKRRKPLHSHGAKT